MKPILRIVLTSVMPFLCGCYITGPTQVYLPPGGDYSMRQNYYQASAPTDPSPPPPPVSGQYSEQYAAAPPGTHAEPPGGAYQRYYQPSTDPLYYQPFQTYRLRSPAAAAVLSLFPGFGCGHFYAGDFLTGGILLGTETIGVSLLIAGAAGSDPGDDLDGLTTTGLVLMTGSIMFDMVRSTALVARENAMMSTGWRAFAAPNGALVRYDF